MALAAAIAFLALTVTIPLIVWAIARSNRKSQESELARGWRMRGTSYEEFFEGRWRSIGFEQLNHGHGISIINVLTAEQWTARFPPWAATRREEILARIHLAKPWLRLEIGRDQYLKRNEAWQEAKTLGAGRNII